MLIRIDENTLEVSITHSPSEGFIPSEESIAISKYAELIRNQQKQFIEEKHNPLIRQLIKMVSDFNYKNDKAHAAQVDALKAKLEAEKQPVVPAPTIVTKKTKTAPRTKKPTRKAK